MSGELAEGDRVQIVLRFPEDEGFARRGLNRRFGRIVAAGLTPGDDRRCVQMENSTARALVRADELRKAEEAGL